MTPKRLVRLGALTVVAATLSALVALSLGHTQTGPSFAQEADGAIAIDCSADEDGVQSTCDQVIDSDFAVQLHVTEAPGGGYVTFQVKVRWDESVLDYRPAGDPADENLWEACSDGFSGRFDNRDNIDARAHDYSVVYTCVPFPVLETPSMETGALYQLSFRCIAEGEGSLELVARETDGELDSQHGTNFAAPDPDDSTNALEQSPSTLGSATVSCVTAAAAEEPSPTPRLPDTGLPGDVDGAGGLTSWLFWAGMSVVLSLVAVALIVGARLRNARERYFAR